MSVSSVTRTGATKKGSLVAARFHSEDWSPEPITWGLLYGSVPPRKIVP
jgi:hypothetical protein